MHLPMNREVKPIQVFILIGGKNDNIAISHEQIFYKLMVYDQKQGP